MRSLALTLLFILAWTSQAAEPVTTPWTPPWHKVEMKASKLFITTTSTVSTTLLPSAAAVRQLGDAGEHRGLLPTARQTARVEIGNSLLGRDSVTTLWLDPADGRALQRIKVETGKKHRFKAVRFTEDGVLTRRRYPREGEEKKKPDAWSDRSEEFLSLALGEQAVVDPTGLLYLLAIAPLKKAGDRWTAEILADDAIHHLEVKVEAVTRIKARYTCIHSKKEQAMKGEVDALHLTLRPRAADGGKGSNFEFLGLEGDVDVYLHRQDRYPLMITGKIPIAGHVKIELERVELP